MLTRERFVEFELRTARDDLIAVFDKVLYELFEREYLRPPADEREVDDAEIRLKRRLRKQLIQYDFRNRTALQIDDDPHTGAVGAFVVYAGYAVDVFVACEFADAFAQHFRIYTVGHFRKDNRFTAALRSFDIESAAHDYFTAARFIRLFDAASPEDNSTGRKIGAAHDFAQFFYRYVGIVDIGRYGRRDFTEIVRRHIRRHTDCDAGRAVYEQIRQFRREDGRFLCRFVEVRNKIDRIFVYVRDHLFGKLCHLRFGIAVCGGGVSGNRTEVSLRRNHRIAQIKILTQVNDRVVHGCVSVRMKFTEHVTDDFRALSRRAAASKTEFVHRVQYAAVNGF